MADRRALTNDEMHAAFEAMRWVGWTYEMAMSDAVRSRVVIARAKSERAKVMRSQQTRRMRPVRRFNPTTGQWRTQLVPGPLDPQENLL